MFGGAHPEVTCFHTPCTMLQADPNSGRHEQVAVNGGVILIYLDGLKCVDGGGVGRCRGQDWEQEGRFQSGISRECGSVQDHSLADEFSTAFSIVWIKAATPT